MPYGGCRVSVLADCRVSYSNSTDSAAPMIIDKVKERLALITRMTNGGKSLESVFSERDVRSLVGVIEQLKSENEALRNSLIEASEEIAAWGSYASDYFQDKHDLAGCVEKFHSFAVKRDK